MINSNFHTHTTFCDGKNTPEEMVLAALAAGCPELGFSGHAFVPFDPEGSMTPEKTTAYRQEFLRLKEKYDSRIALYIGLEQDAFSVPPDNGWDYLIHAVHYLNPKGIPFSVDWSREVTEKAVDRNFAGDWYAYARTYYALVAETAAPGIVAHLDLITKFNEDNACFDENDRRYRLAALEALEAVYKAGAVLEINTGAIRRGYRRTPYPAPFLLKEAGRLGMPVVLSSDAHDAGGLLCAFDEAEELVRHYSLERLTEFCQLYPFR